MGNFLLPGQTVIPKTYGERMVLFTAGDPVECVVDGAPVGPNGRLFKIRPNKPQQVPFEAGRFILEHLAYTGVVRVEEKGTDTGIEYDIEGAKRDSLALLDQMDRTRFNAYVSGVVEDYVKQNKPVPQPSPAIMAIIERRGYDLKRFGIVPIGWADPEKERILKAEEQNKSLQSQLSVLQSQLAALQNQVTDSEDGKKKGSR